jgi:cell volume regulation protein A
MTLDGLAAVLLIGAAIVLVSILSVRFSGRLGIPGLLLYLLLGLLLGSVFPALHFEDAGIATVLGYSALVLILAHGGLTTRLDQLRPVMWPAFTLATLGVAVSIAVLAVPLMLIFGVDAKPALLLGAVLAATDAAAVFAVMRRLRIGRRMRTLLEAEAGFNDAPVVVLVSVIASGAVTDMAWWLVPIIVTAELVGGAVVGVGMGVASAWLLRRIALPAVGLYPIAAVALLVAAYGAADLLHVSGFLAVYVAAVIVGSSARLPHRRSITGFSEGLSWIAEIGLFVMLGLLADLAGLPEAVPLALAAAAIVVLVARPLAAIASLAPFRWPAHMVAFASVAGLRGAVPIVFAAIPLSYAIPQGALVFNVTLIVVLVLALVQTPALPFLGRRLGVVLPEEAVELEVEAAPLDQMHALVLGFEVPTRSGLVGTFVTELGLPEGAVVSLIVRDGQAIAPDEHSRLRAGDQVLVVTTEQASAAADARMRAVAQRGRLARWREEP